MAIMAYKDSNKQNFSSMYQIMWQKSAENLYFQYSKFQRGHNSDKNDENGNIRTWSEIH